MSSNAAEALSVPFGNTAEPDWLEFVRQRLDPKWRQGEWHPEHWAFTGDPDNPATRIYQCVTTGCDFVSETRTSRRCLRCRRILRDNGDNIEDLLQQVAEGRRDFNRIGLPPKYCDLVKGGKRCQRQAFAAGFCATHHSAWTKTWEPRGASLEMFINATKTVPLEALPECAVPACRRQRSSKDLCAAHAAQYRALGRDLGADAPSVDAFASATLPILSRADFTLDGLPEPMRSELLFALQREDAAGYLIDPILVRGALADLWCAGESLLEPGFLERAVTYVNRGAFIQRAVTSVRRLMHMFAETDPFDADVWDSYLVGLKTANHTKGVAGPQNEHKYIANRSMIDFRRIRQDWLRSVVKRWGQDLLPNTDDLFGTIRSFEVMSEVLSNRPKGDDPSTAGIRDIRRFIELLDTKTNEKGKLYGRNWRTTRLRYFRQALHYVRGLGELDHVHPGFSITVDDRVSGASGQRGNLDPDADVSRGIPYRVVDAALAALDTFTHPGEVLGSDLSDGDRTELLRTSLRLLIDTGRRPNEICKLRIGCLRKSVEQIDPTTTNYELVYTNWKGGRAGRTIPIGLETAQVIEKWEERRLSMNIDAKHDGWLFPPTTAGRTDAGQHLSVNNLGRAVDRLISSIPRLESDVPERTRGGYVEFTGKVEAYSFRHAYAQRHADAGADPDALKELMDHKSIETTMGYFTVSAKRKREAVALVAPMALNARGESAPMGSPAAYELASVAVPFGSCTDPTNVKAGGHACPIRFRCAGCDLYRPDPSYLPALEEHLKQLRASLTMVAMAGTAAPWVLDAQREEIASYDLIIRRLHESLDALPAAEREAIDDAGAALRKARAQRPLLPLSVK